MGTISNSMSPKELGALAPGCEAKIISDNGKFLGSGEVGEMLVKTPTIMKGKENNNKRTLVIIAFSAESHFGQRHFGQTVPAKVSLWPKCDSAVFFILKPVFSQNLQ